MTDHENARRAAAAHTEASREIEAFLRRLPELPEPQHIIEFAALLAREEEVRAERQDALDAFGLSTPSIDEEP
jgi:hypothetical protein